jgi:hypothetical protein
MKNNYFALQACLTVLGLTLSTSHAGPQPANFNFTMDTTSDSSGGHQYYNPSDVAGTHTVNYANDYGSGYATGTITGGNDPFLRAKVNLNTVGLGGQHATVILQLDYYFQASGPPGNVPLKFEGNLDYPNPLPTTVGGTAIQAYVNLYNSSGDLTNLAYVNNTATPMVNLPASGVAGSNLNQPIVVMANSAYRCQLSMQIHVADLNATYEIMMDPAITIDPTFAAANPGYTLTFSPGFGPSPKLQIQTYGTNAVISWPASATGYNLQTTGDLTSTNSWTAVTNVPVLVGLVNTVTNVISESANFYRLAY